ncbi:MAG: DNA recombination protein RmuC [Candidatus Thermoplasmatota archaeon]|nr:DNA recombination protein RmuC [Candidatus Thermoplasmatota archaeon]
MSFALFFLGIVIGLVGGLLFSLLMWKWRISSVAEKYQQMIDGKLRGIAGEILSQNNSIFLEMARNKLGEVLAEAEGKIGQSKIEIKSLVDPLKEKLIEYQQMVTKIEENRARAYSTIEEKLSILAKSEEGLKEVTNNLITALKNPQVRGRWGEITLKRLVELAGMVEYCDFETQVTLHNDDEKFRPDMVVRLPSGRNIIVDSKVPLNAYLDSLETKSEAEQRDYLKKHADAMKSHLKMLSGKEYWKNLRETPEFVIMFVPGESFLYAALQEDRNLIEEGINYKVLISTPTSLISLLKTIAMGWGEKKMEENARKISDLGKELYEKLSAMRDGLAEVGSKIESSVKSYNKVVDRFEGKVLVSARKFRDLGVGNEDGLQQIDQLDASIREISAKDVPGDDHQ